MSKSTISSKGQVTIPKRVREVLNVTAGDEIYYEVAGRTVTLYRLDPFDAAFHAALGTTVAEEWSSPEDDKAFHDL